MSRGATGPLDGDNQNAAEENLTFLCLDHHDEYSIPRLSKGLREREVKQWRDELYKEMEYRFRKQRRHAAELSFMRFVRSYDSKEYGYYCAQFRLTNVGEVEIRSPTVSLNLPTNMMAEPLGTRSSEQLSSPLPSNPVISSRHMAGSLLSRRCHRCFAIIQPPFWPLAALLFTLRRCECRTFLSGRRRRDGARFGIAPL